MFTSNARLEDEDDDDTVHTEQHSQTEDGDGEESVLRDKDGISSFSEDSELSVGYENASDAEKKLENINLNAPKKYLGFCKNVARETMINPFLMSNAIQIPMPVMLRTQAATTTPFFQQELLRNSYIYSEELVIQQMQLVNAARVNALSKAVDLDRKTNLKALTQISALTEMSRIAAAAYMATASETQKHINGQDSMHPINSANHVNNTNTPTNKPDDDLNEPTLKFSIDNILKSDFGRRLEYVNKQNTFNNFDKNKSKNNYVEQAQFQMKDNFLTNLVTCASNIPTTTSAVKFCNTVPNMCINSNESLINSDGRTAANGLETTKCNQNENNEYKRLQEDECTSSKSTNNLSSTRSKSSKNSTDDPIVWPAWVYCTRYSDRPSSGN